VFKLRDGKIVRLEIFADRQKALESVRAERPEQSGHVG
jgi:ketosteroid isomerase-like protein